MNARKFDLDAIPRLPDDHPVIVAFSARRDLGSAPSAPAPASAVVCGTELEVTVSVTIKSVAAK